jgi:hypothetical protein
MHLSFAKVELLLSHHFFPFPPSKHLLSGMPLRPAHLATLVLASILSATTVYSGVEVDQLYLPANYNCLSNVADFALIRTFTGEGVVDPFAPVNIGNALGTSLIIGCYHVPCYGIPAEVQIDLNFRALHAASKASYCGSMYIKVFDNPSSHCAWSQTSPEANCNFVKELLNATSNNPHWEGSYLGVFSSQDAWNSIVGPECFGFESQGYLAGYQNLNDNTTCADWASQQFSDFQTNSVRFKQYANSFDRCGFNASHAIHLYDDGGCDD